MPMILGTEREDDADCLDRCRRKRNIAEYWYHLPSAPPSKPYRRVSIMRPGFTADAD